MRNKYVKLKRNEFIFFSGSISHDTFKFLDPISAGFYLIEQDKVTCFGSSFTLGLKAHETDTMNATLQMFGVEAAIKIQNLQNGTTE